MSTAATDAQSAPLTSKAFDVVAFGLFTLMMLVSANGLAAADWADHIAVIPPLAFLAVISGSALARSRFSDSAVRAIGLVYAVFFTGWFLGLTLDPALGWPARTSVLISRLVAFLVAFARSKPNLDTLMFVLLMAMLYWWLGSYGAVSLFRRRHVWRAVLPPGFALLVNAYYDLNHSGSGVYVAIYVLLTFLIIVRTELADRRIAWDLRRIRVPAGLSWDLGRVSVVAALLLVAAAWVGPAFAQSKAASNLWSDVSGPWRAARDRLSDVVAGLRSPIVYVGDAYGPTLQLSGGVKPNNDVVMEVDPSAQLRAGGRFYWQARTYAHYDLGTWTAAPLNLRDFDPRQGDLPVPDWKGRQQVEVTFHPFFPVLNQLYVPASTYWVNRSSQVSFVPLANGQTETTIFVARQPVFNGESYTARSDVPVPTAAELRGAGTEYPDWVNASYLQVPASLTQRTRALAHSLGDGQTTAYDRASAVTAWLRENIQYSRAIDPPPADQDPLDWFLFDYKIGFCNYYASSEVMMLRVLGVPARLAVGYASGTPKEPSVLALRNPTGGLDLSSLPFEVRGDDAHAWPEVFFPDYGWVPFEPTTSQPDIVRPEVGAGLGAEQTAAGPGASDVNSSNAQDQANGSSADQSQSDSPSGQGAGGALRWLSVALGIVAGLALLGALAINLDPAWKRAAGLVSLRLLDRLQIKISPDYAHRWTGTDAESAQAYLAWSNWLERLGVPIDEADTPFERVDRLAEILPEAAPESRQIVDAYVAERFGGRVPQLSAINSAWSHVHRLFWGAYLSGLGDTMREYVRDPRWWNRAQRAELGERLR